MQKSSGNTGWKWLNLDMEVEGSLEVQKSEVVLLNRARSKTNLRAQPITKR